MCTWTHGTDAGQGAIVWVDPAQVSGTAWLLAVWRSLLEPTRPCDSRPPTLVQQVAQLNGQVTHLAQDYRTLAATLRGRSG